MQNIASKPGVKKSFVDGREVIDHPVWQQARERVEEIGIVAGQLAQMMRLHRNGPERDTAFYGAFYCADIGHVMELIAHIPGEPQRHTREAALPRAVEFLRAHLRRRFGDLSDEEKEAARAALPTPGSPIAKAQGVTRMPIDSDHLYALRLVPFFQLLDVDNDIDQAQALWFLGEVFALRPDLANLWLEPAMPRLEQLLLSDSEDVRREAIDIYELIGPDDLGPPPAENDALIQWARKAKKHQFPPIRSLNDSIVQIFPSEERDAIVAAGRRALEHSAIGDPYSGQFDDGRWYRGFRVGHVPDELKPLAIPEDSVVTAVNGTPIGNARELLEVLEKVVRGPTPRRLLVEYVLDRKTHAIEYRIM